MLEIFIALSMQIAVSKQTANLTATVPGEYYELLNVTCDLKENKTHAVGVRYTQDWNGSGEKHIMHTQNRFLTGCLSKQQFANTIVADPYITVIGR